MAARRENTAVDFNSLVAFSRHALAGSEDSVFIEGVGGVMVPLTQHQTVLDWIEPLRIPVLLVTGNYLGSLSHTLTALEVLERRQISVHAVIINESLDATVTLEETTEELRNFTKKLLVSVRRRGIGQEQEPVEELIQLII